MATATATTSAPRSDVRTGADCEWVTPHTFRKTVATVLDSKGASARTISDQLGIRGSR